MFSAVFIILETKTDVVTVTVIVGKSFLSTISLLW